MNKNPYFSTRFRYDERKIKIWHVIAKYLQKYIPEDAKLLEFGAGYCYFINNIKAKEKHALDINELVKKYASKDVKTYIGNISEFKFQDEYFDVIFSSNVLEHMTVDEILITLKEMYRILGGGKLIIMSPNFRYSYKSYFDDYTHKTILTNRSLKDMVIGSGFTVTQFIPKFLPFSAESKLPASPLLTKLYLSSPIKPFSGQMLCIATKQGVRK